MRNITPNQSTHYLAIALIAATFSITACNQATHDSHSDSHNDEASHTAELHDESEHDHEHGEHTDTEHAHDEHEHDHDEHEHHEHKHIGKHVHGEGELTLVVDNTQLVIELASPSMNVFGFEHEPSTEAQKTTVKTQEALLKDSDKLFTIEGGDCSIKDIAVDMPFSATADSDKTATEHATESAEVADAVHSDVSGKYQFNCNKPSEIKYLSVNVFETFTGFHGIHASWVNGDKQGASELNKDSHNIEFN